MGANSEPITAKTIVDSRKVADLGPASADEARQHAFGTDYIEQGALCDVRPGAAGCMFNEKQRERLVDAWKDRIDDSRDVYVAAISAMQFEQLLQGDDDFPWLATLILDLATAGIASHLTSAVKGLHGAGMSKLAKITTEAAIYQLPGGWADTAERLLSRVSDKHLETGVRMAIDAVKKGGLAQRKAADANHAMTLKRTMSDYLEDLKETARSGFVAVRETLTGTYNDAELLASFHSLHPDDHTERMYSRLLHEKLDRFKKSGVPNLGRKEAKRLDSVHGRRPDIENAFGNVVARDTRLVWVEAPGRPRELRYQFMDGKRVHDVIHPGGQHSPTTTRPTFGAYKSISDSPETGDLVPAEFADAAIARHIQIWGEKPKTVVLETDWGFYRAPPKVAPDPASSSLSTPNPAPAGPTFMDAGKPQ